MKKKKRGRKRNDIKKKEETRCGKNDGNGIFSKEAFLAQRRRGWGETKPKRQKGNLCEPKKGVEFERGRRRWCVDDAFETLGNQPCIRSSAETLTERGGIKSGEGRVER